MTEYIRVWKTEQEGLCTLPEDRAPMCGCDSDSSLFHTILWSDSIYALCMS